MEKSPMWLLIKYWILLPNCLVFAWEKKENLTLHQVLLRALFHAPLQLFIWSHTKLTKRTLLCQSSFCLLTKIPSRSCINPGLITAMLTVFTAFRYQLSSVIHKPVLRAFQGPQEHQGVPSIKQKFKLSIAQHVQYWIRWIVGSIKDSLYWNWKKIMFHVVLVQ